MKGEHGKPPAWSLRFLRAICPEHLFEELEGELIQKVARDVKNFGAEKDFPPSTN